MEVKFSFRLLFSVFKFGQRFYLVTSLCQFIFSPRCHLIYTQFIHQYLIYFRLALSVPSLFLTFPSFNQSISRFIPVLPETVVVKLVEASHSNERAKSNPKRIKYLRGGRSPYTGIAQLLEVRLQIELDTLRSTR